MVSIIIMGGFILDMKGFFVRIIIKRVLIGVMPVLVVRYIYMQITLLILNKTIYMHL